MPLSYEYEGKTLTFEMMKREIRQRKGRPVRSTWIILKESVSTRIKLKNVKILIATLLNGEDPGRDWYLLFPDEDGDEDVE